MFTQCTSTALSMKKKKILKNQAVKAIWVTRRSQEEISLLPEVSGKNMCLDSKLISNKINLSCLKIHMECRANEIEKQEQDTLKFLLI